jgi:hypothetical protein
MRYKLDFPQWALHISILCLSSIQDDSTLIIRGQVIFLNSAYATIF